MAYRAYVGNLPFSFTKADLEQLFQPFGAVRSSEIITDRETGRSRGFGFVEMDTQDALQAAMSGLHGQPIGGRSLTVNEARERDSRGPAFRPGPPRAPMGDGRGPVGVRPEIPGAARPIPGAVPADGRPKWAREGEKAPERAPERPAKRGRGMDDYDRHDKSWRRGREDGWE
jgi:cold-inducible RNA-binding protein